MSGNGEGKEVEEALIAEEGEAEGEVEGDGSADEDSDKVHGRRLSPTLSVEWNCITMLRDAWNRERGF